MIANPHTDTSILQSIRAVLVETSHPGNIGGAARALKTMGLSRLELVRPQHFPHADATAMASGADDLLQRARVHETLPEALADCTLVVGTSARPRHLAGPLLDPREAATTMLEAAGCGPVALLFGRERTGLTNDELDHCHAFVRIPCNPDYSSLNLAAAVQVLAYELRMGVHGQTGQTRDDAHRPCAAGELERFYSHLQRVLLATGFLDPANPRHLMRRLRRLFNRARPDQNEINILRGILTSVEQPHPGRAER